MLVNRYRSGRSGFTYEVSRGSLQFFVHSLDELQVLMDKLGVSEYTIIKEGECDE